MTARPEPTDRRTVRPSDRPLLELDSLVKEFPVSRGLFQPAATLRAVDGVTLSLPQGETLGLVGESGSGKTTLGRCAIRLVAPTSGSVRFDGTDLATFDAASLR